MFYTILIWVPLVLGLVPLARIEARRAAERRPSPEPGPSRGSHAKPSDPEESEPTWKRADAARFAAMSVIGAFVLIAHPHGMTYWLAVGATLAILLWEPARWLTAYLVRRSSRQDT